MRWEVLHISDHTLPCLAFKLLNTNGIERDVRIAIACAIISDDRSQVLDSKKGEMSEWLKEHAWKACDLTYAAAPTSSKSRWLRAPGFEPA
jgi:hypothetical protein